MSDEKYEALVKNYSRQVLNTAMRILGDIQKAQDVHQEVFLAIWRQWPKYNGDLNWSAYLYRVTVNKSIAMSRRKDFNQIFEQEEYIDMTEKPDGSLKTVELCQRLAKCLGKLPKRQAEIFVLARIEGLKSDNIAEITGCSKPTVRVHLHRAIKQLAAEFKDYFD